MEIAIGIISAVIAALVSIVATLITNSANKKAIRVEIDKLERELQRKMTEKLYDQRLESYPKAIEITEKLRRSHLAAQDKDKLKQYLLGVLHEIDQWHSTKAGFLLSKISLTSLYELRRALREQPISGSDYSEEQIERIWQAKGSFRDALRADIQLLYREEVEPMSVE